MFVIKIFLFCLGTYVLVQILAVIEHLICGRHGTESAIATILRWSDDIEDEGTSGFGIAMEFTLLIVFIPAFFVCDKLGLIRDEKKESEE